MSKDNHNRSPLRRKVLKSIVAGTGAAATAAHLPESWTRPVVSSVMLPVHAQTSLPPPPIAIEFVAGCPITAVCTGGVDPAEEYIPIVNQSGSDLTLVNVELSNPDHNLETPLPRVYSSGSCAYVYITDSSELCGSDVSNGVVTLFFDGFAPVNVDVPL